jgi:predicted SPOUT superfamily RNA methylase MTH1
VSATCSPWPPPRRAYRLAVAIPGSVLAVEHSLEAKTFKTGMIARALAVYRVDHVIVYRDPEASEDDVDLLALLLRYAEAPPHLKKRMFPLMDELRYAALLPPLRTPPHNPPKEAVVGAIVEGLVVGRSRDYCRVYLGRLGVWRLRPCREQSGRRVTVRIVDPAQRLVEPASWAQYYSGYTVGEAHSIEEALGWARAGGYPVVATSRYGECPSPRLLCGILSNARRTGGLLILFGGPRRGVLDAPHDYTLNTVPLQGSLTVRTEEALHATLAVLNAAESGGWCRS